MPSQAGQVFYSREDESSPRYVVMKAPPRGYHDLKTEAKFIAPLSSIQHCEDLEDETSDDESFCVRDDCEGTYIMD